MPEVTRTALAPHTTLRLGGAARSLVEAIDPDELLQTVRAADSSGEPLLILAGGSNVVIADGGFSGTVALLRTAGIAVDAEAAGRGGDVLVTVQAGQPWDDVVDLAVRHGWCGIECLSGIPGSAGATPIQNVGAYGQEVAGVIATVRVFDRWSGAVRDVVPAECGFAYRTSVFKQDDRYVVLSVTLRLRRSRLSGPLGYAELARALDVERGGRAPLADVRAAVLGLRASKGMVLDPNDPDTFSVGSFFTNPVLDGGTYEILRKRALDICSLEPVGWPARGTAGSDGPDGSDGSVKVSAAWLIERAGFGKGYTGGHPGVAISGKHTLALTNRGTGSSAALIALAREIRDGVVRTFDVTLTPEPVLIGCPL